MSKKREQMERRRRLAKTRQGLTERPVHVTHVKVTKPEEKAKPWDVWIAVAIVVVIIGAFVAIYQFTVKRPVRRTPTPIPTVQVQPTAQSTGAATSEPNLTPTVTNQEEPQTMSWSQPPAMQLDPNKNYEAVIKTVKGDLRIQLYDDLAPNTVNNFVFLARQHFYDGVTFHRVLKDFMAQTGDPTGTGSGGPGYNFADEFVPSLKHDSAGIVSMANGGANTNGSQFFITYVPTPHLDNRHSVFGKVLEGMDVLKSLTARDPSQSRTLPPGDKILTIEIVEK
jgi:cyclophilin family peptidyl-prolyl cis-trans isomerase